MNLENRYTDINVRHLRDFLSPHLTRTYFLDSVDEVMSTVRRSSVRYRLFIPLVKPTCSTFVTWFTGAGCWCAYGRQQHAKSSMPTKQLLEAHCCEFQTLWCAHQGESNRWHEHFKQLSFLVHPRVCKQDVGFFLISLSFLMRLCEV